ncbi:methyltransferase domain-containing protein [Venatoribacter cucullus]|uniref:Methyltransferase domain-containing protein n=1 Tax=Venatoribacter cucullus TaxID=2661630 RepID=A0A9X7UXG0_9GAMM|nr:methyltransferase domain-containing protein [Venatoribacter cucullus]QQD24699.1 methyltransferase domain-containing protein [Venatoribacter cucullus]
MISASLQTAHRAEPAAEHRPLYDQASRLYSSGVNQQNAAKLEHSHRLAMQARALRPDYLPGLNLLARIELQRRNYAAAEFWVGQGLLQKPDSASLLYSAGHIALAQGQLADAEQYFERSARISRVATKALNSLAHVKFLQGDYAEAFRHYRELAKTQADDIQIRSQLFEAAAQVAADFYAEELEQELLRWLDFTEVDYSQLRGLATSLLKHKLRLSDAGCPLELETLAADPLLLKCLQRFYFADPVMERLLLTLRQSLLLSCSRNLAIRQDLLPLVSALAQQTGLNEAVWYSTEQENLLTEQLEQLCSKMLQLDNLNSVDAYPAMLLTLMYKPLARCEFFPLLLQRDLHWPELLHNYMQRSLNEAKTLQARAQQLPSLSSHDSDNDVTRRVQQQYDQNPYPRWTDIGYNQPADYATALRQTFPQHSGQLPQAGQPLRVLVAGCGTGRHAIRLARYFPGLDIKAIDLSRTALAYASVKAEQWPHLQLQFAQADILQLPQPEQPFDVIECSGVLHHMENPQQGLQALTSQLKPGGIIKIALYSATARRMITQLRQLLGDNRPRTDADIRLVREALLQKALPGDWQALYESNDFYSLSACRDLLFHEQEHVFDVRELPGFLARAGLQWMGMLPPPAGRELLKLVGKNSHEIRIEEWHALEQSNPDLFAGMYQFYALKP